MKKLLTLSLAVLMALSLGVTALAANYDPDATIVSNITEVNQQAAPGGIFSIAEYGFHEYEGMVNMDPAAAPYEGRSNTVAPGKTLYIPLLTEDGSDNVGLVTKSDAVKSATARASYILGKDQVSSISIVYKKYSGLTGAALTALGIDTAPATGTGYAYFLAVATRASTSTATKDIAADVTIKKTSGKVDDVDAKVEFTFRLNLACAYYYDEGSKYIITSDYKIFDPDGDEGEQTFNFSKDDNSYFEVDVTGQSKILVKANVRFNPTVAAKYPQANLDFFSGSGTFNKIGTLYLHAEPGSYLYNLNADGTLTRNKAHYDEYAEKFEIRTRTLGSYVISDIELDVTPPATEAPQPEAPSPAPSVPPTTGGVVTTKPNPGTGAAA